MDWKVFFTIFSTVFLAEIGDKTQLSTMLFATNDEINKWTIFLASSIALILASAIGIVVGTQLANYIEGKTLNYIAGVGFIIIGSYTIFTS